MSVEIKNCLIYARVSSAEQVEGYSLDSQEKICKKYAEDNGCKVLDTYRDEGKSGTNLNRTALKDLLAQCQTDNSICMVIVQETDRLARNTQDHLTVRAILKKANIKLVSVAQPMLDDSPEGNMIDTILASVNQFQSEINGRKTKKGLQARFDSGWWPGWVPLGYINKTINEKKVIVPDPERWHLIKKGLKMYSTGNYSAIEITEKLYKQGLKGRVSSKQVCLSTMINVLKNPFYAGLMRWNKQERVGEHKPMISMKEHKQILSIIDNHNHHTCRRRIHNFLLRGFVFCDICGQRYTAEKHRTGKNLDYYHCTAKNSSHSNKGQNIEVKKLEKQVEEKFKGIEFEKEFIEFVVQKVKDFYQNKNIEKKQGKKVLLNQKMGIERKLERAEEKLINGPLSDEDFERIRNRYRKELSEINTQIEGLETQHDVDTDTVRQVLMLSRNIYEAYKKAPYEIKRLYLAFFWESLLVKDKKIVKSEPTELIKTLLREKQIIIRNDWLPGLDSN